VAEKAESIDSSENITRRDFISKASLGVAAAATFASIANKIPGTTIRNNGAGSSIFEPRAGSRLKFWGRWFERFRLR
tara:strand:+ start:696 stop:926 length:231 start_codon:yes stop_codon:yes gene_type:complete